MKNTELIQHLEANYAELFSCIEKQTDEQFNQPIAPGKWSHAQHAEHLILSTRPLNKALRMPKLALKMTFGTKNERPERSYDEVKKKYQSKLAEGNVVSTNPPGSRFAPGAQGSHTKAELIKQLKQELSRLKTITGNWKEGDLTKHLIPHPLIGKMTVREILCFTVYHTERHTAAMQEGTLT